MKIQVFRDDAVSIGIVTDVSMERAVSILYALFTEHTKKMEVKTFPNR
jgi:hypothetical protein